MAIWTLGSVNADLVYSVPHLPRPGETLAATGLTRFLGGKGANMSVAGVRAGSVVHHIGAVGGDGAWAVERLAGWGVDTRHIAVVSEPDRDPSRRKPGDTRGCVGQRPERRAGGRSAGGSE
jgi:ribokinase